MKLQLYYDTLRYLKPSQIFWRLAQNAGISCAIGCTPKYTDKVIKILPQLNELDFDLKFLSRFPMEKLMANRVELLHEEEMICWDGSWFFPNHSPLWNFNLHYFDYLLSLVSCFMETRNHTILDKCMEIISGWISANPVSQKGSGWESYTVSLRILNWMSFYSYLHNWLPEYFRILFLRSLYEQYAFLSRHMEKGILGNHYFENLKTMLLCSLFFCDTEMTEHVMPLFLNECKEEILDDGVHFELSIMYHNIVLEGMIRVDATLNYFGIGNQEIHSYTCRMLDATYSLCGKIERVPLFNDSGNNVAKSTFALLKAGNAYCEYTPYERHFFPNSGFVQFSWGSYKMIVDAGQPGPVYIPGHSHCDAMSFELYKSGKPLLSNCGTFAYQCHERAFFRSTAAHNTVMANGIEQSQCWGIFRLAKRSSVTVLSINEHELIMEMQDQNYARITRAISVLDDSIHITDKCIGKQLMAFYHLADAELLLETEQLVSRTVHPYAEEFGEIKEIPVVVVSGKDTLSVVIPLEGK